MGGSNVTDSKKKPMEKLDRPMCLSRDGLKSVVKVRGELGGLSPLLPFEPPAIV